MTRPRPWLLIKDSIWRERHKKWRIPLHQKWRLIRSRWAPPRFRENKRQTAPARGLLNTYWLPDWLTRLLMDQLTDCPTGIFVRRMFWIDPFTCQPILTSWSIDMVYECIRLFRVHPVLRVQPTINDNILEPRSIDRAIESLWLIYIKSRHMFSVHFPQFALSRNSDLCKTDPGTMHKGNGTHGSPCVTSNRWLVSCLTYLPVHRLTGYSI